MDVVDVGTGPSLLIKVPVQIIPIGTINAAPYNPDISPLFVGRGAQSATNTIVKITDTPASPEKATIGLYVQTDNPYPGSVAVQVGSATLPRRGSGVGPASGLH